MEQNLYDLLDTIVKIGLGALITGIAQSRMQKNKNTFEREQARVERELVLIHEASENMEPNFQKLSFFISKIDGYLRHGFLTPGNVSLEKIGELHLLDIDVELTATRTQKSIALSKLYILDAKEPIGIVEKTIDFENQIRRKVLIDRDIPSLQELELVRDELKQLKKEFYSSLRHVYCLCQKS
ncbi:hypothetical protein [Vibrio cholerae]|uniref:hypothetical protein n=1 Tax=Vibrio cholerae TaxID=666 RepID=UPI0030810D01